MAARSRVPLVVPDLKHIPSSKHGAWPACTVESSLCDGEQSQIGVRATDNGGEDGGKLLSS